MYVIYSKSNCNSCEKAKQLLQENNYEHVIKMLNVDFNILELYEVVPRNVRSFPCVTKLADGVEEYIGGYYELVTDIEKGL